MSLMINQNITALNAWRNLSKTDREMGGTMEKLSSGLRINKAADNPSGLVISEQMRAQVAGLNAAITNSEKGVSMIQTAEGSLDKVHSLLDKMRALAIDSANAGVSDEKMLAANQAEVTNMLDTINRIAVNTQYGTKKLLDGSNAKTSSITDVSGAAGVGRVADYSAVNGTYTLRVSELANGSATPSWNGTGLAAGATRQLQDTLSTGTHNLQLSGSYETMAVGTETYATSGTLTTNTGLALTSAGSLASGSHSVTFSGTVLDDVTAGAAGASGVTITTGGSDNYNGTQTGVITVANTTGGGLAFGGDILAGLTVDDGLGGGAVAATWTAATNTLAWTSATDGAVSIKLNGASDITGTMATATTFTLTTAASNYTVNVDAIGAETLHRSDITAGTYTFDSGAGNSNVVFNVAGTLNTGTTDTLLVSGGGGATLGSVDGSTGYFTGTQSATYVVTLDSSFSVGDGGSATTADLTVTSGGFSQSFTGVQVDTAGNVASSFFLSGINDATGAEYGFTVTLDAGGYRQGDSFTLDLTASNRTLTLDGDTTGAQVFNSKSEVDGDVLTVTSGSDQADIDVSGTATNATATISVTATTYQATLEDSSGIAGTAVTVASGDTGKEILDANGNSVTLDFENINTGVSTLALDDNSLVFQIGANQGQTVRISVQDVAASSLALVRDAVAGSDLANIQSNFASLADIDVTTAQGAQDAIVMIDAAIDQVSTIRGALGAFQANTLEANLDSLRVSTENLQASESVIRDTDMASEMAEFTKYQIMMQAGTAMLAQANQMPQNLLKLLQG